MGHTYIYILQNLGLKKAMGRLSIPLMAVGVLLFALAYCATPSLAEDGIGELDGGLLVELKTLNRELRSAETKRAKEGQRRAKDDEERRTKTRILEGKGKIKPTRTRKKMAKQNKEGQKRTKTKTLNEKTQRKA